MKNMSTGILVFFMMAVVGFAADLSSVSSQDLLAIYKQLRTIQPGSTSASTENVVLKRDSGTFTFLSGRMVFAAPIAEHQGSVAP
jgi:hypothetical protein